MKIREIFIVGSNSLQNELIASSLKEEVGVACRPVKNLTEMEKKNAAAGESLVLCDAQGAEVETLLMNFEKLRLQPPPLTGLFNVRKGEGAEEISVDWGVMAIFYQDESFTQLAKGVAAVLEGQMWISRKVISKCITGSTGPNKSPNANILSTREKEILLIVAEGATNEEVANSLCISKHTVKNHLYNLCKKINVSSRLGAAHWASRNL